MRPEFRPLFPLLAAVLLSAAQNILLLTANSLVYVYEGLAAAELYASLCFLYFSLRLLEERRGFRLRHLFVKCFSPAFLYSTAVLLELDFNCVNVATSLACLLLILGGLAGIAVTLLYPAKRQPSMPAEASVFSAREKEVITLIQQGMTVQETADALFISPATVKTHLQHIYGKACVRNRAELARFVHNHPFS